MAADALRAPLAPASLELATGSAAPGDPGLPAPAMTDTPTTRPTVAEVYDAHGEYVWRCLRSLGVAPSQLDDALQDVFVVVHLKLSEFDGASALRTWLYAIVIRVARKKRTALARSWAEEIDSAGASNTEQEVASKEALHLAHRALAELDPEKREVFVLMEIEQMSAPEVAQILGIPANTAYSRLRAARMAFEQAVEKHTRARGMPQRGRHG